MVEADAVVTLGEAMKTEIVARGVPAERITVVPNVVDSERFFAEPAVEYARLLTYLELPVVTPASFGAFNARPGSALTPTLEAELRAHFAPHDRALSDLLGRRLSWMT